VSCTSGGPQEHAVCRALAEARALEGLKSRQASLRQRSHHRTTRVESESLRRRVRVLAGRGRSGRPRSPLPAASSSAGPHGRLVALRREQVGPEWLVFALVHSWSKDRCTSYEEAGASRPAWRVLLLPVACASRRQTLSWPARLPLTRARNQASYSELQHGSRRVGIGG
jgi:hypothetical protein